MSCHGTIFVVDDDAGMCQAVERLLHANGWDACTFPSAEALLESGTMREAAGFVLDVQLPGLSGFDLAERIAREGVHAPVIFITARTELVNSLRAKRSGAAGIFAKPFSGRELLAALTHYLPAG